MPTLKFHSRTPSQRAGTKPKTKADKQARQRQQSDQRLYRRQLKRETAIQHPTQPGVQKYLPKEKSGALVKSRPTKEQQQAKTLTGLALGTHRFRTKQERADVRVPRPPKPVVKKISREEKRQQHEALVKAAETSPGEKLIKGAVKTIVGTANATAPISEHTALGKEAGLKPYKEGKTKPILGKRIARKTVKLERASEKTAANVSDQLSRGFYAGSAATKAALQGRNIPKAAKRGFQLKEKTSYVDILNNQLGLKKSKAGKVVAAGLGSLGDLTLDPANALGVGEAGVGLKASRGIARKEAETALRSARKAGASEKEARRAAKKAYKRVDEVANARSGTAGVHGQAAGRTERAGYRKVGRGASPGKEKKLKQAQERRAAEARQKAEGHARKQAKDADLGYTDAEINAIAAKEGEKAAKKAKKRVKHPAEGKLRYRQKANPNMGERVGVPNVNTLSLRTFRVPVGMERTGKRVTKNGVTTVKKGRPRVKTARAEVHVRPTLRHTRFIPVAPGGKKTGFKRAIEKEATRNENMSSAPELGRKAEGLQWTRGQVNFTHRPRRATSAGHDTVKRAQRRLGGTIEHDTSHIERRLAQIEHHARREYETKRNLKGRKHLTEDSSAKFLDDIESGKGGRAAREARKLIDSIGYQQATRGVERMLDPGALDKKELRKGVKIVKSERSRARGKARTAGKYVYGQAERTKPLKRQSKRRQIKQEKTEQQARTTESERAFNKYGQAEEPKGSKRQRRLARREQTLHRHALKQKAILETLGTNVTVKSGEVARAERRGRKLGVVKSKHVDRAAQMDELLRSGDLMKRPKETSRAYGQRIVKLGESHKLPKLRAHGQKILDRADEEAQAYVPRRTVGDLDRESRSDIYYEPQQMRRKVETKTARKERRKQSEILRDQENPKSPLFTSKKSERLETTKPLESIRSGLQAESRQAHLSDFFKSVHRSGRRYTGKPLHEDESIFEFDPKQGLVHVSEPTALKLHSTHDYRVLSNQEIADVNHSLLMSGWQPKGGLSKTYLKGKSGLTHVYTTLSPAAWTRNIAGDTANQLLGGTGVTAALTGWRSAAGMAGRHRFNDEKLLGSRSLAAAADRTGNARVRVKDLEGRTVERSRRQLSTEAVREGVTGGLIGGELRGVFGKRGRIARLAAGREAGPRLGSYLQHRQSLGIPESALRTNKFHFDYRDLTQSEKALRDTLFPFITWTTRNARLQVGQALRRPFVYNSMFRVLQERAQDAGFKDGLAFLNSLDPKDAVLFPIPINKDYSVSLALPVSTLMQLFWSDPSKTPTSDQIPKNLLDFTTSLLTPYAKTPIELLTNHSFFFDAPLAKEENGVEYNKPMGPTGLTLRGKQITPGVQNLPASLKKLLGVEEGVDKEGNKTWRISAKGLYLLRQTPQLALLISAGTEQNPNSLLPHDKSMLSKATGVRFIPTGQEAQETQKFYKMQDDHAKIVAEIKKIDRMGGGKTGADWKKRQKLDEQRKHLELDINDQAAKAGKDMPYITPVKTPQQIVQEARQAPRPNPSDLIRKARQQAKARQEAVRQNPRQVNPSLKANKVKLKVVKPAPAAQRVKLSAAPTASVSASPTTRLPTRSKGRSGTYTASVFGGKGDPGTGTKGYKGDDLNKKWDSWAELGKGGGVGNALGGLPYGTAIRVTNPRNGKSLVLYKRDIGSGGAGLNGKVRGVDIWHTAAKKLGLSGLQNVRVEFTDKQGKAKSLITQPTSGVGQAGGAALKAAMADIQKTGRVDTDALAQALISDFTSSAPTPEQGVASAIPRDYVSKVLSRADKIASRNMPYLWGGGHLASAQQLRRYRGPLDCSGAVSKALGIDPRVSGEFVKWGKAGDGGNRGITVYANSKHVFMKINGRFFGTSGSNPGGGANWIPAKSVDTKGFTVRHL